MLARLNDRPNARRWMDIKALLRSFGRDGRGLAAVEFAFIAPIMIALLFGVIEISRAITCRSNVANAVNSVGDLLAQKSALTGTDITNAFNAANIILYPFVNAGKPSIRISSVVYSGPANGTANTKEGKVAWICTRTEDGTFKKTRAKGDTVTFDNPIMSPKGSVVMAEIAFNYHSDVAAVVAGKIAMENTFYSKPRRVEQIAAPAGCT